MESKGKGWNDLVAADLRKAIAVKKTKDDGAMPAKKDALKKMYEVFFIGPHKRQTPYCSPGNSDDQNDAPKDKDEGRILAAETILSLHYSFQNQSPISEI